jgi:hypothetical protein
MFATETIRADVLVERKFGGTIGGAVLQARLIDIGVVSDIDPPWIITIGSSFIGFFAGAYAAIKLGNLALRKNNRFGSKS